MSAVSPAARRPGPLYTPVLLLALLAQAVVLMLTFFMGLGWGSPTWLAALAQAGVGIFLVVFLGTRRSWWIVAVPIVSTLLTFALLRAAEQYTAASECSEQQEAAFAQLTQPADLDLELEGSMNNGCMASGYTEMASADVVTQFAEQLRVNEWNIRERQPEYLEAERNGLGITIEGVPQEGGLVLVSLWDPSNR